MAHDWQPGDDEAAAAAEGMAEVYGAPSPAVASLIIGTESPRVGGGPDRIHLHLPAAGWNRVVILQRVGDGGTESIQGIWSVLDAFAVCVHGVRTVQCFGIPRRVGLLRDMAESAERFLRSGEW